MKEISAGGVVYRNHAEHIEIQLIQDRYGKMSLPKGKMEAGETVEQTALREIQEETGITGRLIEQLEQIEYSFLLPDQRIVEKQVYYYLVEATGGVLQPQLDEIRGVEWLSPEEAWSKQCLHGYENNHSVIRKALHKLGVEVKQ